MLHVSVQHFGECVLGQLVPWNEQGRQWLGRGFGKPHLYELAVNGLMRKLLAVGLGNIANGKSRVACPILQLLLQLVIAGDEGIV